MDLNWTKWIEIGLNRTELIEIGLNRTDWIENWIDSDRLDCIGIFFLI